MKLRKIELKLEGDQFWPRLPIVHVRGSEGAGAIPRDASDVEAEDVIKSWHEAAILRVTPADGRALIGFWKDAEHCQYLNVPVETTEDGLFAMRLGPTSTDFFIVPEDHKTNYMLELVEICSVDDPKYGEVALY